METIEKIVQNLGAADVDSDLEIKLMDGILYAFQVSPRACKKEVRISVVFSFLQLELYEPYGILTGITGCCSFNKYRKLLKILPSY